MNSKTKTAIAGVTMAVVSVLVLVIAYNTINNTYDAMQGGAYQPTNEEIRQMCTDKLNELAGPEYTTPLAVNVCVGTVLDGLNK